MSAITIIEGLNLYVWVRPRAQSSKDNPDRGDELELLGVELQALVQLEVEVGSVGRCVCV